jgi:hypothetical protein
MVRLSAGLFALLLGSLLPLQAAAARSGTSKSKGKKDAILLSDVETLTLRGNGAMTNHRRVAAVPQLKCISHPSLCRLVDIDVMRCTNQGSAYDDADVEWTCSSVLPEELRLGSTDVICEGYSSSDDPYVLKGSCGVEYRVALTPKGEKRYPDIESNTGSLEPTSWATIGFIIIFLSVLGWIVYSAFSNYQDNTRRPAARRGPRRGGNGGGGGGGGDGWGGGGGGGSGWDPRFGGFGDSNDDPPPPYPGRKSQSSTQQQSSSQWRPGFWSGLAGGAAGGYAAGRMGQNRNNDRHNRYYDEPMQDRRGGSSSYSSSSTAGPSGVNRESTGFGSTSRR